MENTCDHDDTFADGLVLYCKICGKKLADIDEPLFC